MPRAADFVLVHGTSHGGWCWARVAALLRQGGHAVFTPTLTGVGERSHLRSGDIDLDTHITDIVNVIAWEDLNNVVLCGHSYGGWVISGVVEAIPDRIGAIVYLDAFLPEDGQRGVDLQSPASRQAVEVAVAAGEISRPARSAAGYGLSGADLDWVEPLLTPQPIGVSLQPIRLTGARDRIPKKAYVLATGYANPVFVAAYEKLKSDPSWRIFEAPCGHEVMIELPDLAAEILMEMV